MVLELTTLILKPNIIAEEIVNTVAADALAPLRYQTVSNHKIDLAA